MYTIDEVFAILSQNKITTNKETVRNWVRKGVIQAEPLESRKKGYRISEESLKKIHFRAYAQRVDIICFFIFRFREFYR